jgi:trichothecene 3-O-acetyltransferase
MQWRPDWLQKIPEGFRPLMGSCNRGYRTCSVIPRKKTGGIEIVMTLSEEEVGFLREDDKFGLRAFLLS